MLDVLHAPTTTHFITNLSSSSVNEYKATEHQWLIKRDIRFARLPSLFFQKLKTTKNCKTELFWHPTRVYEYLYWVLKNGLVGIGGVDEPGDSADELAVRDQLLHRDHILISKRVDRITYINNQQAGSFIIYTLVTGDWKHFYVTGHNHWKSWWPKISQ